MVMTNENFSKYSYVFSVSQSLIILIIQSNDDEMQKIYI